MLVLGAFFEGAVRIGMRTLSPCVILYWNSSGIYLRNCWEQTLILCDDALRKRKYEMTMSIVGAVAWDHGEVAFICCI